MIILRKIFAVSFLINYNMKVGSMKIYHTFFDHELGAVSFNVERITYTRSREGTTSHSVTESAQGYIHPGTAEMLKLMPEEEKNEQFIVIYTDYALSTGTPEDAGASFVGADRIHWNGQVWRVVKVRDWSAFGYVQALAVKMEEGE